MTGGRFWLGWAAYRGAIKIEKRRYPAFLTAPNDPPSPRGFANRIYILLRLHVHACIHIYIFTYSHMYEYTFSHIEIFTCARVDFLVCATKDDDVDAAKTGGAP